MDRREYEDLYQHLRMAVRAIGREDLDIRIVESQRLYDARGSSEEVQSYLDALRHELILGSSGTLRQTIERLRRVQSPLGRGVSGIVLDVQERDRATYGGVTSIDLVGSIELDRLVAEIDELITRVRQDRANG